MIDPSKSDIVILAEKRNEFVMLEDGYWYYWPKGNLGAISEYDLLMLHQELVKRNKKWNEDINEYFRNRSGSDSSGSDAG